MRSLLGRGVMLAIALAVAFAGCDGGGATTDLDDATEDETPTESGTTDDEATGTASFSMDVLETCAGFDTRAAAEILGISASELEASHDRDDVPRPSLPVYNLEGNVVGQERSCGYLHQSSDDVSLSIIFFVLQFDSDQAAAIYMSDYRSEEGQSPQRDSAVEGVGDENFFVVGITDEETLVTRRGNIVFSINVPPVQSVQIEIAHRLIAGIEAAA